MDSFFRLLLRLILVPAGYVAAICAGTAVILFGQWRIGTLFAGATESPDTFVVLVDALFTASFLVVFLVSTMWLVGAIGVLFSELFAVRSWIFHVANGAVSAFLGAQVFPGLSGEQAPVADPFYILAAGLAGGLAYWLIAGWSAGFWKPMLLSSRRTPLPPPPPTAAPPQA
ncbi:hypothetical protein V5F77_12940 [Xanthobacter sp. DSM 24535]|uniref:hypothetical protein n=1 Tax=Roseixanthobacter psychrophilus TaxID=3119917 RepID=UPI00372BB0CA